MTIPKAISESKITLFGLELRCYVLDNGQRIINADDVIELFEKMGDLNLPDLDEKELDILRKFTYGSVQ